MGLMSFLHFSFDYCVTFLALPLLALVYPLCASIRAIETNSFSDIQTLNVYWVVLSLMLLLEHGFMKLFGWSLYWQYLRIAIVCLLVIPYFDGALYVYECFIRLLLSVDPQILINWFKTHKESPLARENFLDELDRYVKENGTEAVEKILTGKSYSKEPDVSHEDIKSLEVPEKKEVMAMDKDQVCLIEPDFSWTKIDCDASHGTTQRETASYFHLTNVRARRRVRARARARAARKASSNIQKAEKGTMPIRENSVRGSSTTKSNKNTEETAKAPLRSGKKQKTTTKDKEKVCQIEPDFSWTKIGCDVSHGTTQRETTSYFRLTWTRARARAARARARARVRAARKASSDIQKAENRTMPIRENVPVKLNSVRGSSVTISNKNMEKTAKAPLSSGKKQKTSTKDKEKVCQIEPDFTWTKIGCDVSHETTQRETILYSRLTRARAKAKARKASSDIQKAENRTMPIRENMPVKLNSVPCSSVTKSNKNKEKTAKALLSRAKKQKTSTKDKEKVCQIEPDITWTKIRCDVSHETTQKETTSYSHPMNARARVKARARARARKASSDIQKAEKGTTPIRENVQVELNSVPGSSATKSNKNMEETAKAPLHSGKKPKISKKDNKKVEKQNKKIPNKQTVEVKAGSLWCDVCKIRCPDVAAMKSHLKGRKHIQKAEKGTMPFRKNVQVKLNSVPCSSVTKSNKNTNTETAKAPLHSGKKPKINKKDNKKVEKQNKKSHINKLW